MLLQPCLAVAESAVQRDADSAAALDCISVKLLQTSHLTSSLADLFRDYSNNGHACRVQRHVQLYYTFLYCSRTAVVDHQKSVLMRATTSSTACSGIDLQSIMYSAVRIRI
jgi:hypothetical protein